MKDRRTTLDSCWRLRGCYWKLGDEKLTTMTRATVEGMKLSGSGSGSRRWRWSYG